MYFAFGWPKFFSTGTPGVIVDIKYNLECTLIACLTGNSVIIWSGDQNRIRLGHSTRKDESVLTTGANSEATWSSDSCLLAVITSGGYIYLYVLRKEWQDPLEFAYVQPHHIPYSLSTPTTKLVHISLASSFIVAHGGASSFCGEGEMLYLVTKNNYIVVMHWTGDIAEQFSISDVVFLDPPTTISSALQGINLANGDGANKRFSRDDTHPTKLPQLPPDSIIHFTYASAIHTFCLVLSNGSVVIMQAKPTSSPSTTTFHERLCAYFLCFPSSLSPSSSCSTTRTGFAVCAALNAPHHLVAIGCDSGEVRLYKIPQLFLPASVSSEITSTTLLQHNQYQLRHTDLQTQPHPPHILPHTIITPPKIAPCRVFTLLHWGIKGEDTGPVAIVQWTRDSRALAVGWTKRGFSLWSINGCRLVCTIPQLEGFGPKSSLSSSVADATSVDPPQSIPGTTPPPSSSHFSSELAHDGVVTLAFGPSSYHLLVATHNESAFMQLSLVKSCLACNPTFCYSERILLQADDRLLFMSYKGNVPGEVEWKHLHIPHTYLLDNWPMKFAAMSRDGTQIAVTGRRGFILYNNTTGRWKMFGDRNQEQEIICYALCWFKHIVVLASLNETIGKYELLLFPKQHLSYSSMAGRQELPRRRIPHLMDCNDSYLALFTKDLCLYLYSISQQKDTDRVTVHLSLYHQVSLASVAVPMTITLLPENDHSNKAMQSSSISSTSSAKNLQTPPQCLIHYTSGKLVLLHLAENREDELATDVEQPWLGTALTDFEEPPCCSLPEISTSSSINQSRSIHMSSSGSITSPRKPNLVSESAGRTLWAYGEQGLTVWVPFPGPHKQLMSRDRSLDFDNEVYPVGFVSDLGIVVGLTQGVSVGLGSQLPFFEIHTKTHPFLHSILRNKIESFDDSQALSIAKKFEYVPHFAHSLELLLHEVLESECENQSPASRPPTTCDHNSISSSSLLSRVAKFMRNFPQFPDIVVQCARKTDAAYWQFLFDGVGDPCALFEDCKNMGKLATAASYLKILQNICPDGHIVSRRAALILLEKVLDIDDVELAGELTRFLGPIPKAGLSNVSNSPTLLDVGITPDDEEYYMQEFLLGKYVRKLLMRKQLRHLLLFAWRVGHSLRPWLENERTQQSAMLDSLEEWKSALHALHLQFYIPRPDHLPNITVSDVQVTSGLTSPPSPDGPLLLPSSIIMSNSLPPASPLALAASTPFARKLPLQQPASSFALSSALIPEVPPDYSKDQEHSHTLLDVFQGGGGGGAATNEPKGPSSASSLSLPSMRDPLFLQDSIEYATADLLYLQEEMLAAKCTEWGLIIATVLMNVPVISAILHRTIAASKVSIWETYRQLLISQESTSQGYLELRVFLDEFFKERHMQNV
eukprot:Phypoly_transcript_00646.p1 GENE.Phypoly_transcript_00646~~Phypoly_transcript_00646.p1  ORF type:complete len:1381 (+),score=130.82 Phypoly_transcript_00646:71-4213(+)